MEKWVQWVAIDSDGSVWGFGSEPYIEDVMATHDLERLIETGKTAIWVADVDSPYVYLGKNPPIERWQECLFFVGNSHSAEIR